MQARSKRAPVLLGRQREREALEGLMEDLRGLSPAQLAGGFGLAGAQAMPARVEESFGRRLGALHQHWIGAVPLRDYGPVLRSH